MNSELKIAQRTPSHTGGALVAYFLLGVTFGVVLTKSMSGVSAVHRCDEDYPERPALDGMRRLASRNEL
jgi:hypothetical protein